MSKVLVSLIKHVVFIFFMAEAANSQYYEDRLIPPEPQSPWLSSQVMQLNIFCEGQVMATSQVDTVVWVLDLLTLPEHKLCLEVIHLKQMIKTK